LRDPLPLALTLLALLLALPAAAELLLRVVEPAHDDLALDSLRADERAREECESVGEKRGERQEEERARERTHPAELPRAGCALELLREEAQACRALDRLDCAAFGPR